MSKLSVQLRRLRGPIQVLLANLWSVVRQSWFDVMRVSAVVTAASWIRYLVFARILRRTRMLNDEGQTKYVATHTVSHNVKGLQLNALRAFSGERPNLLLRIISAIETVDPRRARILFIGPRAESELFLARGYGFAKRNIRGLDLISYSPSIDLGDMHEMPYPNHSWDVIVLGWVLAYSERPLKACEEVARVARPGAMVAIGVQYHPLSPVEIGRQLGYVPGAAKRLESCEEILSLFGESVDQVHFRQDIAPDRRALPGSIIVVFSVKK